MACTTSTKTLASRGNAKKSSAKPNADRPTTIEAFLAEQQGQAMLRLITCCSGDDGKSPLIGRLL